MKPHQNTDFSVVCCRCFSACKRLVLIQSFICWDGGGAPSPLTLHLCRFANSSWWETSAKENIIFTHYPPAPQCLGTLECERKPRNGLRTMWFVLTHVITVWLNLQKTTNARCTLEELLVPLSFSVRAAVCLLEKLMTNSCNSKNK